MRTLGTMREFHTERFTVIAEALEETDLDLSWDEDGSVAEGIDSGKYIVFCARVRVLYRGKEIGVDYLGGCIYESFDDFMDHRECGKQNREYERQGKDGRCGSYFHDMISAAIAEARKTLKKDKQALKKLYIRA
jgi:hypothetical protein